MSHLLAVSMMFLLQGSLPMSSHRGCLVTKSSCQLSVLSVSWLPANWFVSKWDKRLL